MKRFLLIYISLFLFNILSAQEVNFTALAPKIVAVDEVFRLSFTVNAIGEQFIAPSFRDFDSQGPSTSSNYSTQIINGKTKQSVSYSYNYTLRAKRLGKITIGPASITVEGKEYKTSLLTVDVVKSQTPEKKQSDQPARQTDQINDGDLYTRIEVSKRNLYKGEHFLVTIKIYTRLDLARFNDIKLPSYNGFWSQEISTPQQINLQRENVKGKIYNVGVIKKTLLFPQRTGDIVIDPFEIECVIRKQSRSRSVFNDFFGGFESVNKRITSPPVTIKIKELPDGAPANFKAAVGQFSLNSEIDKNEVKANEAITLRITISGNGNLKLIDPLDLKFPPDFEVYDPKVSNNFKSSEAGLRGNISFEYLMIPRHPGDYKIPSVEFNYFDPKSNSYKKANSKVFDIKVLQGEPGAGDVVVSSISKEDVKFLGSDIRYIRTDEIKLKKKGSVLFGNIKFYLAYIIPLTFFLFILIIRRDYIKKRADTRLLLYRRANKVSRKRLKQASLFLKENKREEFCNEVLKAFWGYLSDKLGIPKVDLSKDSVTDELNKFNVDETTISSFMEVIDNCEFDRYSPAGETTKSEAIYNKAANIISKLEQQLK